MSGQCNHWNDRIDAAGKARLRPIQCRREMDHDGVHVCGDSSWGEALGYRERVCERHSLSWNAPVDVCPECQDESTATEATA